MWHVGLLTLLYVVFCLSGGIVLTSVDTEVPTKKGKCIKLAVILFLFMIMGGMCEVLQLAIEQLTRT